MIDLAQIESELAELRQRLNTSSGVLDNLVVIQTEFETLSRTYQKLTDYIDQAKSVLQELQQKQDTYDKQFTALTKKVEGRQEQLQAEVLKREQTLRTDLSRQLEAMKEDAERKRSDFLRDWDNHRESVRNQLDELGVRLRLELKTLSAQLEEAKPGDELVLKVERLESGLRKAKGITLELEQRINLMQKWLTFAISIGFLAFGLSLWPMIQRLA